MPWSSWREPYLYHENGTMQARHNNLQRVVTPGSITDPAALLADSFAQIEAGSGDDVTSSGVFGWNAMLGVFCNVSDISTLDGYAFSLSGGFMLEVGYLAYTFDASRESLPTFDFPPGTDYSSFVYPPASAVYTNFGATGLLDFEAPYPDFVSWDVLGSTTFPEPSDCYRIFTSGYSGPTFPLRMWRGPDMAGSGPGVYPGPRLNYLNGATIADLDWPYSPFPGGENVHVDISAAHLPARWTGVLQARFPTFSPPVGSSTGYDFMADLGQARPKCTLRTPRWRYWLAEVPPVRLNQRNDGGGIDRHPRLNRAAGASSSQQTSRTGRLNRTNTYS